jgi:hypothetical protein
VPSAAESVAETLDAIMRGTAVGDTRRVLPAAARRVWTSITASTSPVPLPAITASAPAAIPAWASARTAA